MGWSGWLVSWLCDHHLLRKKSHMHNFGKYMNIYIFPLKNDSGMQLSRNVNIK